jgi:hypothetical protein
LEARRAGPLDVSPARKGWDLDRDEGERRGRGTGERTSFSRPPENIFRESVAKWRDLRFARSEQSPLADCMHPGGPLYLERNRVSRSIPDSIFFHSAA